MRRPQRTVGSAHELVGCIWILGISVFLWPVLVMLSPSAASAQGLDKNQLSIKIIPSRPQAAAGTSTGYKLEIMNQSEKTIYLRRDSIELVFPPELQPPQSYPFHGGWFISDDSDEPFPLAVGSDAFYVFNYGYDIPQKPSAIASATAATPQKQTHAPFGFPYNVLGEIVGELNFLFFPPGDYSITVSVKYWVSQVDAKVLRNWRVVSESAVIHYGAPQFVVLTGAAIGGLFGYFVFPQSRRQRIADKAGRVSDRGTRALVVAQMILGSIYWGVRVLGAMLLSVVVTILVSRISETQFLVRVTVDDFWGAVAVGTIANIAGRRVILGIAERLGVSQSERSADQKQPAGPFPTQQDSVPAGPPSD